MKEFNRDEYISECYSELAHNVRRPHKHAELIKAWADGAEIEVFSLSTNEWVDAGNSPNWFTGANYRNKAIPNPDIIEYWQNTLTNCGQMDDAEDANLKLTFDGKTGKLKSAEVLKQERHGIK